MAMKGDKAAQEQAMLEGAPVIVANPGRYIEILDKNNFRLKDLKLIVIDEAHEMQQFNLVNRVKDILRFVDSEPQTIILSGEQNSATKQLVDLALKNPELIGFEESNVVVTESDEAAPVAEKPKEIDPELIDKKLEEASVSVVLKKDLVSTNGNESVEKHPKPKVKADSNQGYIKVPPRMKISTLMAHLEQSNAKHVAVFSASSRTSDRLFKIIRKKNWGVVSLGDDLDEATFSERFERFNKYEMRVLLIGGISANKVDLSNIVEIINYDVPNEVEEYHVRAELISKGSVSKMISLVSKIDQDDMERISVEAGYEPIEFPFPEEKIQKKKSTKEKPSTRTPRKKSNGKSPRPKNFRSQKKQKKEKSKSLPRPTYDGLSGGREGQSSESGGVFGWVKKLFN